MKELKMKVLAFLGIQTFATNDKGELHLTEEQKSLLSSFLKPEVIAKFEENLSIEAEHIAAVQQLHEQLEAEKKARLDAEKKFTEEKAKVEILSAMAENDLPTINIPNKPFEGKAGRNAVVDYLDPSREYNSSNNRRWNRLYKQVMNGGRQAELAILEVKASTYTKNDYTQIVADLGEYSRQDLGILISFEHDNRQLPKNWRTLSNVDDEAVIVNLFVGNNYTQPRKMGWLPKGNIKWEPEIAKVRPEQIDVEILGYELQKMEETWLMNAKSTNLSKSGSSPFKMPFVQFLLQKIANAANKDDIITAMNGVYAPTSDTATVAGKAINTFDGVRKQINIKIAERKVVPFNIGKPVIGSLLDYVDSMVMSVPEQHRKMEELVYYIPYNHYKSYLEQYESTKGAYPSYTPDKDTAYVWGHTNIRFEPLMYMGNSNRHFITHEDNIVLLENIPNEGGLMTNAVYEERKITVIADYKKGTAFVATGRVKAEGEIDYVDQLIWCNNVVDLDDTFIDAAADDSTPSVKLHTSLNLPANTVATAITNIDDAVTGDFITLKGTSATNSSTIANSGNFILKAGAWTAVVNQYITLLKRSDGKLVEYARGTYVTELAGGIMLAANATTINASTGKIFYTSANSGATSLTAISNAVEGETYRIIGAGGTTNATTITTSNFTYIASNITLTDGVWIDLIYNGVDFSEVRRG